MSAALIVDALRVGQSWGDAAEDGITHGGSPVAPGLAPPGVDGGLDARTLLSGHLRRLGQRVVTWQRSAGCRRPPEDRLAHLPAAVIGRGHQMLLRELVLDCRQAARTTSVLAARTGATGTDQRRGGRLVTGASQPCCGA